MKQALLERLHSERLIHGIEMERIYSYLGVSRQGYYQKKARLEKESSMLSEIEVMVKDYRQQKDRRAGLRSLYHNLEIKSLYGIGINKFERLTSQVGLSLKPLRIRVVTTQSVCQSWNYSNLYKGLKINDINQLIVGDLTYIDLAGKRYYLFCLTDVYSARIVGVSLSKRMRAIDAKLALEQCVRLRGKACLKGCIHHTDGGSQYFSKLYLADMKTLKFQISVAKNCLENGYAEQRNSCLKHHLIPTMKLSNNMQSLQKELERAIKFYNHERKQECLNWLSPVDFEKKNKEIECEEKYVRIIK